MIYTEILRLLLVIAGILAGREIGASISRSAESQIIGLVLGTLVSYVLGGIIARLVDRELQAAMRKFRAAPAGEIFSGSIVGTTGLLVGLALGIPAIALIHSDIVYPLVAVVAWTLAVFGARIGMVKGRQVIRAAGLAHLLDQKEPLPTGAVLADSSALMDTSLEVLGKAGLLADGIIVPSFVMEQVKTLSESPDPVKSRRATQGLKAIDSLRSNGIRVTIVNHVLSANRNATEEVMDMAKRLGLRMMTCSSKVVETSSTGQKGTDDELPEGALPPIINLTYLEKHLIPDHPPGERLVIDLVDEGRQPRQATGYLDGGELVVVNDASHLIGQKEVPVVVSSTRHTSQGILIFARLAV